MAEVLKQQFRDVDIIARYGGEEFVVILPEITSESAQQVAERVRSAIASISFPLAGGIENEVTASIGISHCADGEASPQLMVARADQALYHAKQSGRNRVELCLVNGAALVTGE